MRPLNRHGLIIHHMLSNIGRCEYLLYMVHDLSESGIQLKRHDIKTERVKQPYKQDWLQSLNEKNQRGEADSKRSWRSEKEKALGTNGIREGFLEKMKLCLKGWEGFIQIQKRGVAFQVQAVTHNCVSSSKMFYLLMQIIFGGIHLKCIHV